MDKNNENIDRKFTNRLGCLSRKNSKCNIEVNVMSWNNGRNKLDIRVWTSDGMRPLKGVALTREEYYWLIDVLCRVNPMKIDCEKRRSNVSAIQQEEEAAEMQEKLQQYAEKILPDEITEESFTQEDAEKDEVEFIDEVETVCENMPEDNICMIENTDEIEVTEDENASESVAS